MEKTSTLNPVLHMPKKTPIIGTLEFAIYFSIFWKKTGRLSIPLDVGFHQSLGKAFLSAMNTLPCLFEVRFRIHLHPFHGTSETISHMEELAICCGFGHHDADRMNLIIDWTEERMREKLSELDPAHQEAIKEIVKETIAGYVYETPMRIQTMATIQTA